MTDEDLEDVRVQLPGLVKSLHPESGTDDEMRAYLGGLVSGIAMKLLGELGTFRARLAARDAALEAAGKVADEAFADIAARDAEIERLKQEVLECAGHPRARDEIERLKAECASISAEFDLPPTMRPVEGEIRRMGQGWKDSTARAERAEALVRRLAGALEAVANHRMWNEQVAEALAAVPPELREEPEP